MEHQTAGEAIEKILQEKKISSKINYDVLKGLTVGSASGSIATEATPTLDLAGTLSTSSPVVVAETKPVVGSSFGKR